MSKPILGITMGDPFGNGPEITVRAQNDGQIPAYLLIFQCLFPFFG